MDTEQLKTMLQKEIDAFTPGGAMLRTSKNGPPSFALIRGLIAVCERQQAEIDALKKAVGSGKEDGF